MEDKRILEYQYLKQLNKYMKNTEKIFIPGKDKPFIYPKQLEIHLPSDRNITCNLGCEHCFSTLYKKSLGKWESEGLKLLENLKGKIPYSIFGGAYTEPTANPYLFPYLDIVKKFGNHFGLHTNGTYLLDLEEKQRFLTNVHDISTDKTDYISISLDAGSGKSWSSLKKSPADNFWKILSAIEKMTNIRDKSNKESHAIRVVYLVSEVTCDLSEFEFITSFAKMCGIDSLRFSIPYDYYNKHFDSVREYKKNTENMLSEIVKNNTKHLVSKDKSCHPYIFYNDSYYTDIDRFNFDTCYYGFFQITLGADGYVYPCSAVAAPTAKHLRRGVVSSELSVFKDQCWEIQNNPVKCKSDCFKHGLRGNRMALEINEYFNGEGNNVFE